MKITILGAGKSGISAALLAKKNGDTPFLSEYKTLEKITRLDEHMIPYETGGHTDRIYDAGCVVLSPGIKKELPVVRSFEEKNIEIISEIEYAYRSSVQICIGITGSNGKTTTTELLGQMLRKQFGGNRTCGNIGIPFSDISSSIDNHPIAIELSSFQLETIVSFKPKTSILLNVSPNHLDWYSHYDDYVNAKLNLLKNCDESSELVVNAADSLLMEKTADFQGKRYTFSLENTHHSAYIKDDSLVLNIGKEEKVCHLSELNLRGPHHLMNMMAASISARLNGIRIEIIKQVITSFNGLEHRMEFIRRLSGVNYINDSKSTSVEALKMALQSYDSPIILLAGGKHKGASYSPLSDLIKQKTKKVFVFGEAKNTMYDEWNPHGDIEMVEDLQYAVKKSVEISESGDIVLLSPACSSFDQFKSYEARGHFFKQYVNEL